MRVGCSAPALKVGGRRRGRPDSQPLLPRVRMSIGTGDNRAALAAARPMDEYERRTFVDGEPPVAELHQGDEARIEIEAHFCQPILLASSDMCRDLPENLQPRQLS